MQLWTALKSHFVKVISKLVHYQENDPSTPELDVLEDIPSLPNPCPKFTVMNFTGSDAPEGTVEHQATDIYCTIVFSITYIQSKLDKMITKWTSTDKLIANPRAGKMFNAYYDRYFLNFFYDTDTKTNKTIYTCDSTDVVAHELGHAILDCFRPDLWGVQSVEVQAFHEAFGDINAILTAMTFKNMVINAIKETEGDLSKPNVISRLAEQMGVAIGDIKGEKTTFLRNAVNDFKYVAPETLPTLVPGDELAGEPHSFSRVFVGAWYDSFLNIYKAEKTNPEQAVYNARDKIAKIMYNAVTLAQMDTRFYSSILKAMLLYDSEHKMGCGQYIKDGFAKHNILDNVEQLPSVNSFNIVGSGNTMRLSDFIKGSDNPLHDCIIEVANPKNNAVGMYKNEFSFKDAIFAAKHALKVLNEHGRVGKPTKSGQIHQKEFAVIEGKLTRNYYCCRR